MKNTSPLKKRVPFIIIIGGFLILPVFWGVQAQVQNTDRGEGRSKSYKPAEQSNNGKQGSETAEQNSVSNTKPQQPSGQNMSGVNTVKKTQSTRETTEYSDKYKKRGKRTEQTVLWSKIISLPALSAYLIAKRRKNIKAAFNRVRTFFKSDNGILECQHFWRLFAVAALFCVFTIGIIWVTKSVWAPIVQEYVASQKGGKRAPKNADVKRGQPVRDGQR